MWELVSFAQGSSRKLCLTSLATGPRTPSSIAHESKEHLSHISRSLRELTERGLVECLTPNATKNRIYGLTELGQKVLAELQRMDFKH